MHIKAIMLLMCLEVLGEGYVCFLGETGKGFAGKLSLVKLYKNFGYEI